MLTFNLRYFIATVVLFLTEVLIAVFVHDQVIRPHIGDLLVVILLYCFVRSFMKTSTITTCIFVLSFAYFVEAMQYVHIVEKLHLQHSNVARVVIGTTFSWTDIAAYTMGILVVILGEFLVRRYTAKA